MIVSCSEKDCERALRSLQNDRVRFGRRLQEVMQEGKRPDESAKMFQVRVRWLQSTLDAIPYSMEHWEGALERHQPKEEPKVVQEAKPEEPEEVQEAKPTLGKRGRSDEEPLFPGPDPRATKPRLRGVPQLPYMRA